MLRLIGVLLVVLLCSTTAYSTGLLTKFKSGLTHKTAMLGSIALLALGTMSCDENVELNAGALAELLVEQGEDGTAAIIKIGMNYDGSRVPNAKDGAELAVAQINEAGGGVLIELVALDNTNSLVQSIQLTNALVGEHQVHAIIGPESSTHAIIVGEVAQRVGIPMITTAASNPDVTASGRYVFMTAFPDSFQGQLMAKFAIEELAAETAAILTNNSDVYSEGLSETFADNFTLLGGEVVKQQFYDDKTRTFAIQLLAIDVAKPDVVFIPGHDEVAQIVKDGRALGIEATFLGGDGWGSAGLIAAGGKALEGAFFSDHFHATPSTGMSEDTLQFIADFVAMYCVSPISSSAFGYDAVYLVAQAIERAGSLDGAAIKDALAVTKNYSGATSIVSLTDKRHAIKSVFVKTIEGGKVVFYKMVTPPSPEPAVGLQ